MRALKILVAMMGVMIVGGVAVLAAMVVGRMSKGGPAAPTFTLTAFSAPAIDIPAGGHIEAMSTGPDRVVLDLVLGDGTRQLVIIDLASGKKLGTIPLRPLP